MMPFPVPFLLPAGLQQPNAFQQFSDHHFSSLFSTPLQETASAWHAEV